jgi:hypothetical protein
MNNLVILPCVLFPPIPWFALLLQTKNTIIELHETYPKQTFRNRFSILTSNGMLEYSLPVSKPHGNHSKTKEILLHELSKHTSKILTALESAYFSSPFFEFFIDDLSDLFHAKYNTLVELNIASVKYIEHILRIQLHQSFSSDYSAAYESSIDLRTTLSPKNNAFYSFPAPSYHQVFSQKFGFMPNLSILDLVFNIGLDSIDYLSTFPVFDCIKHIKSNSNE